MSVQTEINRISGNVADALAALAEKGVTVPTGAKSDNLAELIAAIEAGGGGELVFATGTYTPSENTPSFEVTHNMGTIPLIAVYVHVSGSPTYKYKEMGAYINGTGYSYQRSAGSTPFVVRNEYDNTIDEPTSTASKCYAIICHSAKENTIVFGNNNLTSSNSYCFQSGKPVTWIVAGVR